MPSPCKSPRWRSQPARRAALLEAGDVLSGVATGFNAIIDSIGIAAVLFASPLLDMHLNMGISQYVVGFLVTQTAVALLSRATRPVISPPGYEVVPGLLSLVTHLSETITADVHTHSELISSVAVGIALVSMASAMLLMWVASRPKALLVIPESVKHGVFAFLGLRMLDVGVQQATSKSIIELLSTCTQVDIALLLPSQAAGFALWLILRFTTAPLVVTLAVPVILLLVVAHVHLARMAAGLTLADAQERRWLLPSTEGGQLLSFWSAIELRAVRWPLLLGATSVAHIASAAVVGPVLSCLNLSLLSDAQRPRPIDPADETRRHALSSLSAAALAGAPCYFSLSCTAVHYNCGAVTWASAWVAILTALAFLAVPQSFELVGVFPRAAIATTCAYIGVDFAWDGLASGCAWHIDYLWGWLTFALCTRLGTLGGAACATGMHALLVAARDEVTLATLNTLRTPDNTPRRSPRHARRGTPKRTPRSRSPRMRGRLPSPARTS